MPTDILYRLSIGRYVGDTSGECRSIYRPSVQNTHDALNILKDKLMEGNDNTEHMVFGLRFIKKISRE